MIKEAIVLAGGLGTRLSPVVPDLPKCLAPVAGKPFLQYLLDHCRREGIREFIFALGYRSEAVESFLKTSLQSGYRLSVEKEPLGTGGAIKLACAKSAGGQVMVFNADSFFGIGLEAFSQFHEERQADCTLALKPMSDFARYGSVELDGNGAVTGFREKEQTAFGFINAGVYALNSARFQRESLPEKFSFEQDYLQALLNRRKILGMVSEEYFIDIGVPEDYRLAQTQLPFHF
jgi:D-glycero-alpha-D-manno-heptose 1-phosphate guanylyltransferase